MKFVSTFFPNLSIDRKTNVAMLAVASHFRDVGLIGTKGTRVIETGKKVVYIAPMKALAQEVVEKFSTKLKPLGLIVRELTGDVQLTRAEAESANVIVTTPEKWDVVTRKSGGDANSLGNQCGLLIIDEVCCKLHLMMSLIIFVSNRTRSIYLRTSVERSSSQ
jgi:replicative superfamily II helicase